MNIKSSTSIIFVILGILFFGACTNQSPPVPNASPSPTATTAIATPKPAPVGKHEHGGKGGQIIETGTYHLEFIAQKEENSTHLDFYLQKGEAHVAVADAKVTAQIQLPDGTEKSLEMKYDPADQHYTALLSGSIPGEHKIAILTDISGEKINGRFTFTK